MRSLFEYLHDTGFATAIRESAWLFPTIETIHVLALTVVVGSIAMVDLRLLQVTTRNKPVRVLMGEVLPWTWGSFLVAITAGFFLFSSRAPDYWAVWTFRMKAALLVMAGLNMLFFHLVTCRTVQEWDKSSQTPIMAKVAGGLSLLFWIGVVACGRWTGFLVI